MSETVTQIALNKAKDYVLNNIRLQLDGVQKGYPTPVIYLSGPPGIGKSDLLGEIAVENAHGLNCQYLGTMQIEQLGLPLPSSSSSTSEFARWSLPELYSMMNLRVKPAKDDDPVILLLDDMHLASKVMQTYLFQLFTYRSIHNRRMPDNFVMVAAGNRSQDRAGAQPIMAPIVNRLFFVDLKASTEDWLVNFAIPKGVRSDIISFIEFYPHLLQSEPLESTAWASPRSWTYTSQSLDCLEQRRTLTREDVLLNCKGHIGLDYSTKFTEYRELFMKWRSRDYLDCKINLPDMEKMEKIDQYTFISSMIAEFMKHVRARDFNVDTKELHGYLKVVKKVFEQAALHAKPLIPLTLRSIIFGEKSLKKTSSLYFQIINGNEILTNVTKSLLGINT